MRHPKAPSAGPTSSTGRRTPIAFFGALVLAITVCLGAAAAIADTPPSVTVNPATEVSYVSVHLSGTVNPEGGPSSTTWLFETTTDPTDPSKWEPQYSAYGELSGSEAEGTSPVPVGGDVYLTPGVKYWFRLIAENGESANRSETPAPYPFFTTIATPPPAVTIGTPTAVTAVSADFSGTINPGNTDPAFYVTWKFVCTPECPGLGEGTVEPGTSPEPVSSQAKGLQPNTTYQVSLVAKNGGAEAEAGPKSFTTDAEAPFATTVAATVAPSGTSATIGGRVNPRNSATTYWVEYGLTDSYGQSVPASEDANAGSGGVPLAVSQQLNGLAPETTYHFRVVAKNAAGTTPGQDLSFKTAAVGPPPAETCPNQVFRVGLSAALPDCRAYEQVSIQDKNETIAEGGTLTADGEHAFYGGTANFAGSNRGGPNGYAASRTPNVWVTRSLSPPVPLSMPQAPILPTFILNDNGSKALVMANDSFDPVDTNHRLDAYIEQADGSLEWISRKDPDVLTDSNLFQYSTQVGYTSPDLSEVVFNNVSKLTTSAAGLDEYAHGLYYWSKGTGIRLVNVDSNGDLLTPWGAYLGAGTGEKNEHAVSEDGERIFFTTPADIYGAPPPEDIRRIYLRESDQETTQISASQCTQPSCQGPERNAFYQGATTDGSAAFFVSAAQLTDDATPGGGLYRYDVGSGDLTLLTPDATDPGGADVKGAVGNSDDGSLVYFVAAGKLADGASLGANNLYVYDEDADESSFIATLDESDSYLWLGNSTYRPAEVTPSGRNIVFRTAAPLSAGYDNAGHFEIYRYDAPEKSLTCIACTPVGSPAQSDISFGIANLKNSISADGKRVFFQTAASLISRDTNGKVDVYQWHDGALSLLSSGTSTADSLVGRASASGSDVLISTWQRLTPSDTDEYGDVYDVRVNGGFAPPPLPDPTTPCAGAGCRGNGTSQGASPSPGSATFKGGEGASPGSSAAFRVDSISPSQAKGWAKSGLLALKVKVPGAGRVGAVVKAKLGKRTTTVARASRSARRAGTVSLSLRLSKAARSYLERQGQLQLKLAVTYSKSKVTKRTQVMLRSAGKSASRGQR